MQPAELALRTIWGRWGTPILTGPKWSAGPTRRLSWCTSNGWATSAGHKGRRTGRQPATRGARRASRSLHLAALAAPCSPYSSPRPSSTLRAFPAPAVCSWGPKRPPGPASGLPAGCLPLQRCVLLELCLPALSARALLQRVHPCSGPGQSSSSWGCSGVLGVPRVALGGSRNVLGGQDLNGRPVLSFDRFFQCHPLSFATS